MQSRKSTIILLVSFFIGLSVLLYPSFSSYWNSKTQSEAIVDYEAMLAAYKPEDYSALFEAADRYNASLAAMDNPFREYSALEKDYWDILDVSGTGMIGYLTVPKIGQELPLYHGTSDAVLAIAAGHMQGTSLPVGGTNTNCVIAGHRGYSGADYFKHLDLLKEGDSVQLVTLWNTLNYTVSEMKIIEPYEVEQILIQEGRELLTLLTCHPYASGGRYRYIVFCERSYETI